MAPAGPRASAREERQAALRELPWRNHGVIFSQASAEIGRRKEKKIEVKRREEGTHRLLAKYTPRTFISTIAEY